jgi:DNA-binding response OmpR family regulator
MARILVIEDDRRVGDVIQLILGRGGHYIEVAPNGRLGLRAFGASLWDLVITDLLMPDMDGIEVIKTLRAFSSTIKVLAISGGGMIDHGDLLHVARQLGATAVLPKPFSARQLSLEVDHLLTLGKASTSGNKRSPDSRTGYGLNHDGC